MKKVISSLGPCPAFFRSFLASTVDLRRLLILSEAWCCRACEWKMPEKAVWIPTVKHSFSKPWKLAC